MSSKTQNNSRQKKIHQTLAEAKTPDFKEILGNCHSSDIFGSIDPNYFVNGS